MIGAQGRAPRWVGVCGGESEPPPAPHRHPATDQPRPGAPGCWGSGDRGIGGVSPRPTHSAALVPFTAEPSGAGFSWMGVGFFLGMSARRREALPHSGRDRQRRLLPLFPQRCPGNPRDPLISLSPRSPPRAQRPLSRSDPHAECARVCHCARGAEKKGAGFVFDHAPYNVTGRGRATRPLSPAAHFRARSQWEPARPDSGGRGNT